MDRLVYLSNSQIPFRAANSVQVMRMGAAFAGEGLAVTLWHEAGDPGLGDPFAWYGVEPGRFDLRRYPDRKSGGRLRRRAGRLVRRLADEALPAYLGLAVRPRYVYGRSLPQVARWLRSPWARRARTGLELHVPPERPALLEQLREAAASPHLTGLVAISPRLRTALLDLLPGFPPERLLVAPSAGEPVPAGPPVPTAELEGRFRLGYAGGLNAGAGIETVAEAIRGLEGVVLHVAGGTPEDVAALRFGLPADAAVRWHGLLPPAAVPGWLAACDALVAPYAPDTRTLAGTPKAEWMSPLKLFEYMAVGRPILASNLPAVADVLTDGRTALLLDPIRQAPWRDAVIRLRDEPGLGTRLGSAALAELRCRPTWQARARRILEFLDGAPADA